MNTETKIKYLSVDELMKMHGETVLFCIAQDYYAAKVSVSPQGFFMCNSRINGGAQCQNQLGMRGNWFIKPSEVEQYFIFKDDEMAKPLIELDKEIAEFYVKAESFMAETDAKAKKCMKEAITQALEIKREIASEALRLAAKNAENATSDEGIELVVKHLIS